MNHLQSLTSDELIVGFKEETCADESLAIRQSFPLSTFALYGIAIRTYIAIHGIVDTNRLQLHRD